SGACSRMSWATTEPSCWLTTSPSHRPPPSTSGNGQKSASRTRSSCGSQESRRLTNHERLPSFSFPCRVATIHLHVVKLLPRRSRGRSKSSLAQHPPASHDHARHLRLPSPAAA